MRWITSILIFLIAVFVSTFVCGEASDWHVIEDQNLEIEPGSPLDFSSYMDSKPAGAAGRVEIHHGRLLRNVLGSWSNQFNCASAVVLPSSGNFPSHDTALRYAKQLRLHGYNIARFSFVDLTLMQQRHRDFAFDPQQLDRFQFLLAAMKREGIYWILDAMTSWNGALGDVSNDRWARTHDLKFDIFFDRKAQAHWRGLVDTILSTKNPYTGLAPLADPALAFVILVNENDFDLMLRERRARNQDLYPPALKARFVGWLRARFHTTKDLQAVWGDLSSKETLEHGDVDQPNWAGNSSRSLSYQAFLVDLQVETTHWMTNYLRSKGYTGPTTAYDATSNINSDLVRSNFELVDEHNYFDLHKPDIGEHSNQQSSVVAAADYARTLAISRWLGRPFSVTEYGQPYWNKYRREVGIVIPSIARLQDWDMVCLFGNGPVDLSYRQTAWRKKTLFPFADIGLDPITRATETLSFFLFFRGDVQPAASTVALRLKHITSTQDEPSRDMSLLGLIYKVGLTGQDLPRNTVMISQSEGSDKHVKNSFNELVRSPPGNLFEKVYRQLEGLPRALVRNELPPSRGIFQSETGQIVLDAPEGIMKVITPKTEAVTFVTKGETIKLGNLTVLAGTDPSLISISTLDNRSIQRSGCMLVIVASDARASGVRFLDPLDMVMADFGHLPVLIQHAEANLAITVANEDGWKFWSLHLDGSLGEAIRFQRSKHRLVLKFDNFPSHGPTTFWVLRRNLSSCHPIS